MRLYTLGLPTSAARAVIDHGGFDPIARVSALIGDDGMPTGEDLEYVDLRDLPPGGLTFSRTTEVDVSDEGETVGMTISGGPVLLDDPGDFVLSIEVPDDLAREHVVTEEPGRLYEQDDEGRWVSAGEAEPASWPFREFWLSPQAAAQYWDSLTVYDSNDQEEVRPDLVGK